MNTCKKIIKFVPIISFGLSLLLLVAGILLSQVPAHESYTYENGVIIVHSLKDRLVFATGRLSFLVLCGVLFGAVVVSVLCVFAEVKWKEKTATKLMISLLVGVVCLFMIAFGNFAVVKEDYDPQCYTFTDGQHTIVIEETSYLLGGWGTVYQVKDDNTAVVIGTFSTDDGLRNRGVYKIIWSEDSAEITYLFNDNATETETVMFEP